jgi:hypothetical protein
MHQKSAVKINLQALTKTLKTFDFRNAPKEVQLKS